MDALSGVHLHRLIREIFVLNSSDQRIVSMDIIFDYPYPFALVKSNLEKRTNNLMSIAYITFLSIILNGSLFIRKRNLK